MDHAPRLRGRQAEAARNDQAVLTAAREVFGEQGFETPIAAVAERAGVGVGTLYRRYGSKEELLQRLCILSMRDNLKAVEQGLADPSPWDGLVSYIRTCVEFSSGSFAPIAGEIVATPEMWELAREVHGRLRELTHAAIRAGALREDLSYTDVAMFIEHFSRSFPAGSGDSVDHIRQRQLAIGISGLRAGAKDPLPPPAPTRDQLEARWQRRG